MHRIQGYVSWEEYRDTSWVCRDGMRKVKGQSELNLVSNVKNNKMGFYRYDGQIMIKALHPLVPQSIHISGVVLSHNRTCPLLLFNFI